MLRPRIAECNLGLCDASPMPSDRQLYNYPVDPCCYTPSTSVSIFYTWVVGSPFQGESGDHADSLAGPDVPSVSAGFLRHSAGRARLPRTDRQAPERGASIALVRRLLLERELVELLC
jgi:hypothetical protein